MCESAADKSNELVGAAGVNISMSVNEGWTGKHNTNAKMFVYTCRIQHVLVCHAQAPYTFAEVRHSFSFSVWNPWIFCVYLLDFWLNLMHEDFQHLPLPRFIHTSTMLCTAHAFYHIFWHTHIARILVVHSENGRMMIKIGEMVRLYDMAVSCGKWTATTGYRHNRNGRNASGEWHNGSFGCDSKALATHYMKHFMTIYFSEID